MLAHFFLPFFWGLIVLVSWAGFGRIFQHFVFAGSNLRLDFGICAAFGVAIELLFGGAMVASRTCSTGAVVAMVAIGAVCFVFDQLTSPSAPLKPTERQEQASRVALIFVLGFVYAGSVCWQLNWNAADDFLSYAVYPIKMLQTGTLDDPFNLRRILTFGGYSFLQALTAPAGWPWTAFQLDIGLGSLLTAALVFPMIRQWGAPRWFASLVALMAVMIPLGRDNLMCSESGMAMFVALFRTLNLRSNCERPARLKLAWAVGGIAGALVTLRPQFLPVAGITVVLSELLGAAGRNRKWAESGISLCIAAVAGFCVLGPWSFDLHRSCGTFLFPLMHGNDHRNVNYYSTDLTPPQLARFVIGLFLVPKVLVLTTTGLLAFWRFRRDAVALWIGAFTGAAILTSMVSLVGYSDITRYVAPPLVAAAIIGVASLEREPASSKIRPVARVLVLLACAGFCVTNCVSSVGLFRGAALSVIAGALQGKTAYPTAFRADYQSAQAAVPPGQAILSMSIYPFMFDFSRNRIDTVDFPGSTSPGTGIPFKHGPSALKKYLTHESINWLIVEDFDTCEGWYGRAGWKAALHGDMVMNRLTAPFYLDLMDSIDALAKSTPGTRRIGSLRLIPLTSIGG